VIPEAEWTITVPLVEGLVRRQFPHLDGPVTAASSGWDNAMFRLGSAWAVRLPRRASAVPLLEKERRWLGELAPGLPLAVPVPRHSGAPDGEFPWPWTIQPWLEGEPVDQETLDPDQAVVLAGFWRALHRPGPFDAPLNPFRGGPLADRAEVVSRRLTRLAASGWVPGARLDRLWARALATPLDLAPTWIHADLHPRNVLATQGRLTGVLDWGDLAVGDPAVDLAAAWMLLEDPVAQGEALEAYGGVSAFTASRALGWAFVFGVMFLEAGLAGDPLPTRLGLGILARVERFDRARGALG